MARLTIKDFHPEVIRLFNQYVHGSIDRRAFLDSASRFAGKGMTAAAMLQALSPNFAAAQQIKPDDSRLATRWVDIPSPKGNGKVKAYVATPAAAGGPLPGVLVVHENRGLNPHIEDIARRIALEGFMAVAPDALTPLGGYPGKEEDAVKAFGKLDQPKAREDFIAAAEWLRGQVGPTGKVGVIGFCWGGAMTNLLAVRLPWLSAAVPFYGGSQPSAADAQQIHAALQIHNAEKDDWVNPGAAAYDQALTAAHVRHEMFTYPGTVHGFNNDTTPRYDEAAAKLAWGRAMAFLHRELG